MLSFLSAPTESKETSGITDITVAMEDAGSVESAVLEAHDNAGLVQFILERFQRSEHARLNDEHRWMRAYRNYRGVYGPDVQFRDDEKSRAFIKVTKTKVNAAYGQLIDVLFSSGRFPIGIDPTELPEGVVEAVHVDPQAPPEQTASDPYGFPGDGRSLPPGATLKDLLGPLEKELEGLNPKVGEGQTPTALTFHPAMVAAKRMEKKIQDQLTESSASKHLRSVAFEITLFGHGILKGPFTSTKELPKWVRDGAEVRYEPVIKTMPRVTYVRIWDVYNDPDATCIEDSEFLIERHKMSRTQLRELKRRPHFRENAIESCIESGTNYIEKWWESNIRDSDVTYQPDRWEVLEYWGVMDRELAEAAEIDIPDEYKDRDQIQVNAWICGSQILRLVFNPFRPDRIPYQACPYEHNPYSFFGVGVAENMEDTQLLMNGFLRLAVDNGVLSGNVVFEIDETMLVPGQDFKLTPGKVFRRNAGQPGQSIHAIKIPNITNEILQMFDKARMLADESTNIPSFAHGQQSAGLASSLRTSSGMSMLMGAASVGIKAVIKNIDDYLLKPLGEALFAFNMQFDYDDSIKGDLEVKARGTESLMQNEVRSQRLMTLMQVGTNPAMAPHIKWHYILTELARALDLDPEKVANNPQEAMRQALLMQSMGAMPAPGGADAPPGANPLDPTNAGGGNIAAGGMPQPGMPGFTGSMNGPTISGATSGAGQQPSLPRP